jgi:hypothetical protein
MTKWRKKTKAETGANTIPRDKEDDFTHFGVAIEVAEIESWR